jgi:hypothetical protein
MASLLGIAKVAGSDAHYGPEIGCAYTFVDAEPDTEEIIKAVRSGLCEPFGNAIPLGTRLKREFFSLKKRIRTLKNKEEGRRAARIFPFGIS